MLGALLETARLGSSPAIESARMMRSPAFIFGILFCGLAVPLGLLSYYAAANNTPVLLTLAGIFLLGGNFLLRYYTLRAGVRVTVYP